MKYIEHDDATEVLLTADEAKATCRIGQGEKCCAFLVVAGKGFECIRMSYPMNGSIFKRLDEGTMNAKGMGGWKGCAWEKELQEFEGKVIE